MPNFLWLYDGTNTLVLDSRVISCSLGGMERKFKTEKYSGAPGSAIKGIGSYDERKFIFSIKDYVEGSDYNFWNSRRKEFLDWACKRITDGVYLYMNNGENDTEVKIRIYFNKLPDDKFNYQKITESKNYEAVAPYPFFEKTTATTDTLAITGSNEQSMTFTVGGSVSCAPTFGFTPTADQTSFRVRTYENYLFQLDAPVTFYAGIKVSFNMKTGQMLIGSSEVKASQYLSRGSTFNLPIGSNTIYIKCSGAGTFDYSYYERYI